MSWLEIYFIAAVLSFVLQIYLVAKITNEVDFRDVLQAFVCSLLPFLVFVLIAVFESDYRGPVLWRAKGKKE